jgi:hypothetical protein
MVAALDNTNMSNLARFAKGSQKRHRRIYDDDSDYMNKNCPRARFDWIMKNAVWECSQVLQIGGSVDAFEDTRHFEDQGQAKRVISLDPAWERAEPKQYHLRNLNQVGWSSHLPVTIKEYDDNSFPTKSDTDCLINLNAATEFQFQKHGDFDAFMNLAKNMHYVVLGTTKAHGSVIDMVQASLPTADWARADLDLDCSTDIDVVASMVPPKAEQVQFHVTIFANSKYTGGGETTEESAYHDYVYEAALACGNKVTDLAKNASHSAAAEATDKAEATAVQEEAARVGNASIGSSSSSSSSNSSSTSSSSR